MKPLTRRESFAALGAASAIIAAGSAPAIASANPDAELLSAAVDYWTELAAEEVAIDVDELAYETAAAARHEAMERVVSMPARTVAGLIAKLEIADDFEGFTEEAAKPDNTLFMPRLMVSTIADARRLAEAGA